MCCFSILKWILFFAAAAQNKPGKSTQAIEDEALAMLDMMEEVANSVVIYFLKFCFTTSNNFFFYKPVASATTATSRQAQEQEADDLLASIDALVGGPSASPATTKPVVAKPVSPPPAKSPAPVKQTFGPRSECYHLSFLVF